MTKARLCALVTGSTGFIGSHLVRELIRRNYRVYCLIRRSSSLKWIQDLPVELVNGEYDDPSSLARAVRGKDYIFHVGARIGAPDWEAFRKANVDSTEALLRVCADVNPGVKKFVFVSSIAAAGPAPERIPLTESDPCRPFSLYGRSKKMAEEITRSYSAKLPVVIIRPTNILGTRQKQLFTMMKLIKKRVMPLIGNGDKQTTICFVQDLVRALILAAESETARNKTYFVASAEAYSWRGILSVLVKEMGYSRVMKIPYPVLYLLAWIMEVQARFSNGSPVLSRKGLISLRRNYWLHDVSRIKEDLGFSVRIDLSGDLRKTVRWYRENGLL